MTPGLVDLSRHLPFPRDRVFRALSRPEEFVLWFGCAPFRTLAAELDLREGGTYRIEIGKPDGGIMLIEGVYLEVSPPARLVFTWGYLGSPDADGVESIVTISLAETAGGTDLRLTHRNLAAHTLGDHERGWLACLATMTEFLGKGA